jgi:hypothetical protein
MKLIIIVCEGQTEQAFCNSVLRPHFKLKEIEIKAVLPTKTGGGIVNWESLKHQIIILLKHNKTAVVTTFIDYYGLPTSYLNLNKVHTSTINEQLYSIENEMKLSIDDDLQHRFYPYIQLHEFEALLFINVDVFNNHYDKADFSDYNYLVETINTHSNPESINNGIITAPSKRLEDRIFHHKKYNKILHGAQLASNIGLQNIRDKCPRFNTWITQLHTL